MLAPRGQPVWNDPVISSKSEIVTRLMEPGVVAIVRAKQLAQVQPLVESLIAGGIVATEITMTTPNALAAIKEARQLVGERSLIGVGSVVDAATCRAAISAGAQFIVTPDLPDGIGRDCACGGPTHHAWRLYSHRGAARP